VCRLRGRAVGSALAIFEPSGEVGISEGIEWRRYAASAGAEIVGRFTFGVQSEATRTVWVNGPDVEAVPLDPGGRRGSRLRPIEEGAAWSTAVRGPRR